MVPHLPARFDDARDVTLEREHSETDTAHLEFAKERPRAAALLATISVPNPPFWRLTMHVDGFCHDQVLNGIPR
jgi:hypothetical protein